MNPFGLLLAATPPLSHATHTHSVPLTMRRRLVGAKSPRRRLHEPVKVFGSVDDDYMVPLEVGGKIFHVDADTGSSQLAVAGDASLGCVDDINTKHGCSKKAVGVTYGSGYWRGVECTRDVKLGGIAVPGYELSGIESEYAFITCPNTPADSPTAPANMLRHDMLVEGIIGMSLDGLAGATPTSRPLMYALFDANPEIPRAYGMQCCAYDAISESGGVGAFDIGEPDPAHYSGVVMYAEVTVNSFWGVDLLDVKLDGGNGGTPISVLRDDAGSSTAYDSIGGPKYIVDSGTSNLLLRRATYAAVVKQLAKAAGDGAPPLNNGFWNGTQCGSLDVSRLPEMVLELRAEEEGQPPVALKIPPTRYLRRANAAFCAEDGSPPLEAGKDYYELNVGPIPGAGAGILGQVLFEEYYVLHHLQATGSPSSSPSKPRIGFAKLDGCGAESYWKPPTLAAAPAVSLIADEGGVGRDVVAPATDLAASPSAAPALLLGLLALVALVGALVATRALSRTRWQRDASVSLLAAADEGEDAKQYQLYH